MKKLLFVFVVLFTTIQIYAQESQAVSTEMNNARFEVIQNPNARKYTFYLDKVEGNVFLLVQTKSGGFAWEQMDVYPKDNTKYTEPTYQIFIGGIAAADTFLINTNLINTKNGRIWNLVQGSNDKILWEEIE